MVTRPFPQAMTLVSASGHSTNAYVHRISLVIDPCAARVSAVLSGVKTADTWSVLEETELSKSLPDEKNDGRSFSPDLEPPDTCVA